MTAKFKDLEQLLLVESECGNEREFSEYCAKLLEKYTEPENISIDRKQNIRKILFIQYPAAMPFLFSVGCNILRSVLMIAVNTEESGFHCGQILFHHPVPQPSCVVQSNISQNDDNVLGFWLKAFKKRIDRIKVSMNVTSNVSL